MKREIALILCMAIGFSVVEFFADYPIWVSVLAALIVGMWCDLRNPR